jgi:hypothetical protein
VGLPKVSDWISVKDRLPADEEDVLIYTAHAGQPNYGWFRVGYYWPYEGKNPGGNPARWYVRVHGDDEWEAPTHWMPLPTGPRT